MDKHLREVGLAEYLQGAEIQFESDEQRQELVRALENATSPASKELWERHRYRNWRGELEWTLADIVRAHVVPAAPLHLSEEKLLSPTAPDRNGDTIGDALRALRQLGPSAGRCYNHAGRTSVVTYNAREYCQRCSDGIDAARTSVDKHVEPKECFVWYVGSDTWEVIPGTGCAHWVSHELGFDPGADPERCLVARAFRIATLVKGRPAIARKDVQVRDIMVTSDGAHCGLVISVASSGATITIRHDSSAQGGVKDNDFDSHFKGKGTFYR